MKKCAVDRAVLLNIATGPSQQRTINNTAAENNKLPFYVFGSVHPDAEDKISELKRIKELGLYGIKLHPEYQNFFIDDKKLYSIYEECESLKLPIIFHAGCDLGFSPPVHATPDRIRKVIDLFPKLTVIAAHFGGYKCWDMVEYFLSGQNVYFDTAFTAGEISPERMKDISLKHGIDKILFASDCPWKKMSDSIKQIEQMRLSTADTEKIFEKNALRLLHK